MARNYNPQNNPIITFYSLGLYEKSVDYRFDEILKKLTEADLTGLSSKVSTLDSNYNTLSGKVNTNETNIKNLQSAVSSIQSDLTGLATALEELI